MNFCVRVGMVIAVLLGASSVSAQEGFSVDRWSATPSPEDGMVVQQPRTPDSGQFFGKFVLGYQHDPVVVLNSTSDTLNSNLITNRVSADVVASFGVVEDFSLTIGLPLTLYQNGELEATQKLGVSPIATAGLGDLRLGGHGHLYGGDDGFQFGVGAELILPSGRDTALTSDGRIGGRALLKAAYLTSRFTIALHLGASFRPTRDFHSSYVTGPSGEFALGAFARLSSVFRVGVEFWGGTGFTKDAFGERPHTPLELALSGWLQPHARVNLGLTLGAGINRAVGVPAVRGQISVAITTSSDE